MIRAGKLRHKVTFRSFQATQDSMGGSTQAWADFATCRCSFEFLQGREFFDASREQGEITARIRMRYLAGVDESMRVVFEGKEYEITAPPIPDGRKRELQIMVKVTE